MSAVDLTAERLAALGLAVESHRESFAAENYDPQRVVRTADAYWEFLTAPVSILIIAGPVLDQGTGGKSDNPGGSGMVAIKDTQKFPLTVKAFDAKGNEVQAPTDVTYSVDNTDVASIVNDDAGAPWVVAGNPGSAVVTGDWPDSPHGDLQGTLAVDVTTGDAASLSIEAGDVTDQ